MQHMKARAALARAERMFAELTGIVGDTVAFQDHVPYVLDLLLSVTRVMHDDLNKQPENRVWWDAQKDGLWRELSDLRHAELKRLDRRTELNMKSYTRQILTDDDLRDIQIDLGHGRSMAKGDTVSWAVGSAWFFVGDSLDSRPVLAIMRHYLDLLPQIVVEAERRLSR